MAELRILTVCFVLAYSALASAASSSITTTVSNVGIYGNGVLYIDVTDTIDETLCPQQRQRIVVAHDHPKIDTLFSLALAAMSTGSEVTIRTNSCLLNFAAIDQSGGSWMHMAK